MTTGNATLEAVEQVAADYRRRGYDVKIGPSGPDLPTFLEGFQPDLIAIRGDDKVVVEVKPNTRMSVGERLREIAERVHQQSGWRFSLVFIPNDDPQRVIDYDLLPLQTLDRRIQDSERLMSGEQREAAFLLLWSTAEGLLRLLAKNAQLPVVNLPPSVMLRELYSAGELSREAFETLLRLLPDRDSLVHGVDGHESFDVESLHAVVRSLADELHEQ